MVTTLQNTMESDYSVSQSNFSVESGSTSSILAFKCASESNDGSVSSLDRLLYLIWTWSKRTQASLEEQVALVMKEATEMTHER